MSKLRIGLVGLGAIGRVHADSIVRIPEAALTAVCDVSRELTERFSREFGAEGFADDASLMASGLVDAVVVATPPPFHAAISIRALERGLHCLCEKPVAVTVSEADRLVAASKASGCVFGVLYPFRLLPWVKAAKEMIDAGSIGEVSRVAMIYLSYRTQDYYDSRPWRATWKGEGGGLLMNQGTHVIDLLLMLGGQPRRITAGSRARLHHIEAEDEVEALLEYPNGAWGYFYASNNEVPPGMFLEIVGSEGKISYQEGKLRLYEFEPSIDTATFSGKEESLQRPGGWREPKATVRAIDVPSVSNGEIVQSGGIMRNFCGAILSGDELVAPGEGGLGPVEFANGIVLSASRQEAVEVPVDRRAYDELFERLTKRAGHPG